jgi:hypothetical protein
LQSMSIACWISLRSSFSSIDQLHRHFVRQW